MGVSFQTASKVLNGRDGVVSADTRKRILAAADELGYVPNALARSLVRQSSLTVGILVDDFTDASLWQFVSAAHRAADRNGHAALVASTSPSTNALRRLLEYRVNGVLVIAPSLEDDDELGAALRGGVPAVSLNHVAGGGVPLVGSDHTVTGALAAEHLLEQGHQHIGTVTGPMSRHVTHSRLRGFRATLQAGGEELPDSCIQEADWTPEGARAATHRLLDAHPGLTALFVHSDVMATGVAAALRDRSMGIPDECSLVGCDDIAFSALGMPPLTTVHVPFDETGLKATELLAARIRGEQVARRHLLPVHLVVRSSTAPPRSRGAPSRSAPRRGSRPARPSSPMPEQGTR